MKVAGAARIYATHKASYFASRRLEIQQPPSVTLLHIANFMTRVSRVERQAMARRFTVRSQFYCQRAPATTKGGHVFAPFVLTGGSRTQDPRNNKKPLGAIAAMRIADMVRIFE
jgi:hypothetical protein